MPRSQLVASQYSVRWRRTGIALAKRALQGLRPQAKTVAGIDRMENRLIKVLLVEGDLIFARAVRESLSALTASRIDLRVSENLDDATRRLNERRYDAVLLNLFLADSRGMSTFAKVHSLVPTSPIVILTGRDNESLAIEAVRRGAQDYLVRSKVDGKILSRVIRYAIERKRVERRLIAQHAVTSVLAESTTLSGATPKILQAVCESLEWEMGALWKVDELVLCLLNGWCFAA